MDIFKTIKGGKKIMKKFIYKLETISISKMYGGCDQQATVYQLKNNELIYLGTTRKWCTRGYMGAIGEVNDWLVRNGHISQRLFNIQNGLRPTLKHKDNGSFYYSYGYGKNQKYDIREI